MQSLQKVVLILRLLLRVVLYFLFEYFNSILSCVELVSKKLPKFIHFNLIRCKLFSNASFGFPPAY